MRLLPDLVFLATLLYLFLISSNFSFFYFAIYSSSSLLNTLRSWRALSLLRLLPLVTLVIVEPTIELVKSLWLVVSLFIFNGFGGFKICGFFKFSSIYFLCNSIWIFSSFFCWYAWAYELISLEAITFGKFLGTIIGSLNGSSFGPFS